MTYGLRYRECSPTGCRDYSHRSVVPSYEGTYTEAQGRAILNKIAIGIWQQLPLPMLSRYLAQMGWDWIILDLQHSPIGPETTYGCIHSIRAGGSKPLVRVPIGGFSDIQRYLDFGSLGIIVPMVNSRDEAMMSAQAAKYPPLGRRSIGGDVQYHYGEDYAEKANREVMLLVQIEHIDAVDAAEEIMSVQGVDGCFVGPTDLALSMGLPHNDFEKRPEHQAAIQRTLLACQRARKLACCNTYSLSDAREKANRGYHCITLESDMKLFVGAAQKLLTELRSHVRDGPVRGRGPKR